MAFDAVPVTSPVTSPVKSPTKVVDVVTPVANISPSELSVTPEPTLTLEVAVKIPVTTAPVLVVLSFSELFYRFFLEDLRLSKKHFLYFLKQI